MTRRLFPLTGRQLLAAALLTVAGCTGDIGGDDSKSRQDESEQIDAAWSAIRRMTPAQYERTLRDLLGDPELQLDLDEDHGEAFSRLGAEKLALSVEQVAAREGLWQKQVFPCDAQGPEDLVCVESFIEDFGFLAFRRPLSGEEALWLRGVYDAARTQQDFHDSLMVVLQVILQSPQLFYFPEYGVEPTPDLPSGVFPLSGYERATRMAYFLTGSTPDRELLEAAELGDLDSSEGVALHAERLLQKPAARGLFRSFFADLFLLDGNATQVSLEATQKSATVFPEDSPALRAAMRLEIDSLIEREVFETRSSLASLFTTREAFVDGGLAGLYGVAAPSGGSGWVTLPEERAGLLTRAAFLTMYARGDVKSPVRRGAFIVKDLLCVELGEPPPNANDVPITGGSVQENGQSVRRTIREDVQAKTMGEGCSGCHNIMNPVGFALDNFDGLGRYETAEFGSDAQGDYSLPIDTSGALPDVGIEGNIKGPATPTSDAVSLSSVLADSEGLAVCMGKRWVELATSRRELAEDETSVRRIVQGLSEDRPLYDLVRDTVLTDAFLYLRKESAQ